MELRPELERLPDRMTSLRVSRGYPVPWFVSWNGDEPEFRAADGRKMVQAIRDKRCWVCGEGLGRFMTFVAGPMCGINRTSAEPPCHLECAQWSARNCPFLSRPHAHRREEGLPPLQEMSSGVAIERNPGVTLLWTTRAYKIFDDGNGGVLINIGDPVGIEWWAEGKPATREQVEMSIETGLPNLVKMAETEAGAINELNRMVKAFRVHLPAA